MISKSSGKITKVSNADDVEIKYGHIIQVLTDWIDTTTVSYTHLDVYKRQGLYAPDDLL